MPKTVTKNNLFPTATKVNSNFALATCRGGITADAIGWLKLWARISVRETGEGVCVQGTHMQVKQESSKKPRTWTSLQEQEHALKNKNQDPDTSANTQDLPCFGALEEGNTPTAALA